MSREAIVSESHEVRGETLSNHEAHEGHEEILFVLCGLCGKIYFFLRALRDLRGEFVLVAAPPRPQLIVIVGWKFYELILRD
jgi:hypothetical protein